MVTPYTRSKGRRMRSGCSRRSTAELSMRSLGLKMGGSKINRSASISALISMSERTTLLSLGRFRLNDDFFQFRLLRREGRSPEVGGRELDYDFAFILTHQSSRYGLEFFVNDAKRDEGGFAPTIQQKPHLRFLRSREGVFVHLHISQLRKHRLYVVSHRRLWPELSLLHLRPLSHFVELC